MDSSGEKKIKTKSAENTFETIGQACFYTCACRIFHACALLQI